jgi:hypothetical protein
MRRRNATPLPEQSMLMGVAALDFWLYSTEQGRRRTANWDCGRNPREHLKRSPDSSILHPTSVDAELLLARLSASSCSLGENDVPFCYDFFRCNFDLRNCGRTTTLWHLGCTCSWSAYGPIDRSDGRNHAEWSGSKCHKAGGIWEYGADGFIARHRRRKFPGD